jgi:PAS domain-containing protein
MINLYNTNSYKRILVAHTIVSFVLYTLFILVSIALIDFLLFYEKALCFKSFICYLGVFLFALLIYFTYFKFKLLSVFKFQNLENLTRITTETAKFINKHRLLEMFAQNLVTMVENNAGVAMWIKDEEDKYVFANKALRNLLFKEKEMFEIIGKTDGDILGYPCNYFDFEKYLKTITPEKYPEIKTSDLFEQGSVCNLTDVITRVLKVPCRFYEEIGDKCFDVFKTPLLNDSGEIVGTVGTLFDITDNAERKKAGLVLLEKQKQAFRINGSKNYYIKQYSFGELL